MKHELVKWLNIDWQAVSVLRKQNTNFESSKVGVKL